MSLSMAQQTVYMNQLRFQSTLLIPLNARLAMLNSAELDEDDLETFCDEDDLEDDTL